MQVLYVIAPQDFRDEEYFKPLEILKKAGIQVITASLRKGKCIGMFGGNANAELSIKEAIDKVDSFDALIIAGGSGAVKLREDSDMIELVKKFYEKKKLVAAICISPTILAKAGILKGKQATVWSSALDKSNINLLQKYGAIYKEEKVVIDDNIVTASGPEAAQQFGEVILRKLR
ncbi:MAG: DJ-1/PfpI/YhbO family deglycase/protease [Candidatus Nanoarchaeia archaeon]|nr:DJ-1/PfpI family protein [Candidatus Haiyanarchaeum thermophilum]MCW1302850.1 DJ-1/PfpI family protein [Candidatus Haiyanarchaeum thermophilum]MCW1303530.1 DJ-1/PfpI family protein [Candidatus Haiyanarchaeum thermophilum]MCW1306710.1 DJ-1/PfpI family protein [Candidatus Haiyanarchaeum thermophilum]MCW1307334.1 DJ-1/PfpI family protein [Candidatus Haiyanarchaeum thermophilum]